MYGELRTNGYLIHVNQLLSDQGGGTWTADVAAMWANGVFYLGLADHYWDILFDDHQQQPTPGTAHEVTFFPTDADPYPGPYIEYELPAPAERQPQMTLTGAG